MDKQKKILFIFNTSNDFINSRLKLVLAVNQMGYNVSVILPSPIPFETNDYPLIKFYDYKINRKSINPYTQIRTVISLYKKLKTIKPDLLIAFRVKVIIYSLLCGILLRIPKSLLVFTGLGYVFTNTSNKARFLKKVISHILKSLSKKSSYIIVQNHDDYNYLVNENITQLARLSIIPGSGIDVEKFQFSKECQKKVANVLLISRLQYNKGIKEYLKTINQISLINTEIKFTIIGRREAQDVDAISESLFSELREHKQVEWIASLQQSEIIKYLQRSNIVCLPSHREGLPRVLLEALAVGRAIVTTDAPGCREVVVDNENGLLVPVGNANAMTAAILELLNNPAKRLAMGLKSREFAVQRFSDVRVIDDYLKLIRRLLVT